MFRKHHLHLHVIFIHEKNIVYTFLFLIMLITLITSGSLKGAFVLNANDMHIKVMFIWTFWYLICIFLSSYELIMNFQSFGQTVKGHSRDLDGKSKGKTEQARKVRAKPVGRNQLGVKMQLSLNKNIAPSKVTDRRRRKRGCLPVASTSLGSCLSLNFTLGCLEHPQA